MNILYLFLLLFYAAVPPVSLFYTLKMVYHDKYKYGIHLHYTFKYLITLSFLPLFFFPYLKLGLIPESNLSLLFLITTFILMILGIKPAIKNKNLFFYFSGVFAAFMEEILYRGIIFALLTTLFRNIWISLIVSSFFFGCWHLKNYYWVGKKDIINQFLYTAFIYGPIFSLMRIYTGDIYLAVLFHFITDATCALAPNFFREWLVKGGRGKNYDDKYIGI